MGGNRETGGSRYDQEKYNRSGSRYETEQYNRKGSRYSDSTETQKPDKQKPDKQKPDKQKTDKQKPDKQKPDKQKPDKQKPDKQIEEKKQNEETAVFSEPDSKPKDVPGNRWKRAAGLTAAAAALIIYIGGAVHYSNHYYEGTSTLGVDCSGLTSDEVREQIQTIAANYKLSIHERNDEQSLIYASQIGLRYDEQDALETALKQQKSYLWPFRLKTGSQTEITGQIIYEDEKLAQVLDDLPFLQEEDMIAPKDAKLEIQDHVMVIVPETRGTTLNRSLTEQVITGALDNGLTEIDLEETGCYIDPEVYADDPVLTEEMNARNAVLGAAVTLNFGSRTETVDEQQLMEWMTLDAEGTYYLPDEAVWNYVSELAEVYDTYGGERVFYSSIGTTEYLYGGDYGWQLEQNETAQTLLNALRSKTVGSIDPVYLHTGMSREENDIGDTYVEICITRQEMWFYKNGELLVDTPVVTGNPSKQNDTPAGGVWALDGKYLNFTLVGEDYRTPVSYWMPFNGGVGIHDLQSRAYFGGTIYLTNGSHGCVNTPLTAVAEIYDNIVVGTPVIVYTG